MGSLLRVFFGKEVGKKEMVWDICWAAGPKAVEARWPEIHFFQRNCAFFVLFLCFFVLFFVLFRRSRAQKKHNSYHKKSTKKAQFIPQKKAQFIPQKKAQKKQSHFPFFPAPVSAFFCACFVLFFCFFLLFFCFWKVAAFKAFSIGQPGPAPAPTSASQPARPLVPQHSPAPRLQPPGSAPTPCPGSVQQPRPLYVLYTHILLFCYRRCDGQHSKP